MRAPRYPLRLPIRYRRAGDPDWRQGLTENISRSGLLFRAPELLDVDTPLEISIRLSPESGARVWPDEMHAEGLVVRTVAAEVPGALPAMAAVVSEYHLAPS